MTPTRRSVLLALAVVVAAVGGGLGSALDSFGAPPAVPRSAPGALVLLAAIVLAVALALRARLRDVRERRPGARPVDPLLAARAVVLAKSAALGGALVGGLYAGYTAYLVIDLANAARRGLALRSGLCVVGGVLLVAVGLLLERVCRIPPEDGATGQDVAGSDGVPPARA